jgi:hypothetical protein
VTLEPTQLLVRTDSVWSCALAENKETACEWKHAEASGAIDTWNMGWRIEKEPSAKSIDQLVLDAKGIPAPEADPEGNPAIAVGLAEIAGFRGAISTVSYSRRPITALTFQGWKDDARGRLKLTIQADGFGRETTIVDPLTLMLTTSVGPDGFRVK